MSATLHDLAPVELKLDCVRSFGGGKNNPSHHKTLGSERDCDFPARSLRLRSLDSLLINQKARLSSHQLLGAIRALIRKRRARRPDARTRTVNAIHTRPRA